MDVRRVGIVVGRRAGGSHHAAHAEDTAGRWDGCCTGRARAGARSRDLRGIVVVHRPVGLVGYGARAGARASAARSIRVLCSGGRRDSSSSILVVVRVSVVRRVLLLWLMLVMVVVGLAVVSWLLSRFRLLVRHWLEGSRMDGSLGDLGQRSG